MSPLPFEVLFGFAFVKELKEGFNQAVLASSEVGFVPLENHRDGQGMLSGKNPHLRAVDKTGGGQLELEIDLIRLVETDGGTGPCSANQGKMDPGIQGNHCENDPRIPPPEGSEEAVGMPSVSPQDSMFDLVQGKTVAANLVGEAVKKPGDLFHGPLETQFDHSMDHHGIVNVYPESEALLPAFQGSEVESFQFTGKIFVPLEDIRAPDGSVPHPPCLYVDEPPPQIGHGQRQSDINGLFEGDPG